jgi:hypothetical protein
MEPTGPKYAHANDAVKRRNYKDPSRGKITPGLHRPVMIDIELRAPSYPEPPQSYCNRKTPNEEPASNRGLILDHAGCEKEKRPDGHETKALQIVEMRSKKGGALPNFHGKVYTINQFMVLAENPVSQSRRRLSRKETPVNPARIQAVDAKHVKEAENLSGRPLETRFRQTQGSPFREAHH